MERRKDGQARTRSTSSKPTYPNERMLQLFATEWTLRRMPWVDEGNERYDHVPSKKDELPSGHDWISNETLVGTRINPNTGERVIRTELFEASNWLVDRLFDLDESMTLSTHECVCSVCHYTINKHAVCPNCSWVETLLQTNYKRIKHGTRTQHAKPA